MSHTYTSIHFSLIYILWHASCAPLGFISPQNRSEIIASRASGCLDSCDMPHATCSCNLSYCFNNQTLYVLFVKKHQHLLPKANTHLTLFISHNILLI